MVAPARHEPILVCRNTPRPSQTHRHSDGKPEPIKRNVIDIVANARAYLVPSHLGP
jgi:hypothetical protein